MLSLFEQRIFQGIIFILVPFQLHLLALDECPDLFVILAGSIEEVFQVIIHLSLFID